mmetsp:Transcript_1296/g.1808  ORF Transcript_1296/g.1808 Transcript_1296/m.1808 type:complete len:83 (+) Transcript_1296:1043-1291(+)
MSTDCTSTASVAGGAVDIVTGLWRFGELVGLTGGVPLLVANAESKKHKRQTAGTRRMEIRCVLLAEQVADTGLHSTSLFVVR